MLFNPSVRVVDSWVVGSWRSGPEVEGCCKRPGALRCGLRTSALRLFLSPVARSSQVLKELWRFLDLRTEQAVRLLLSWLTLRIKFWAEPGFQKSISALRECESFRLLW